jgi:hypothetical protein
MSMNEAIEHAVDDARADDADGGSARGSRQMVQIAVTLPRATLRIIDEECAPMGWRRSVFLTTLLVSKLGRCRFERRREAPQYVFSADDWTTTVRYLWSLNATLKAEFKELRLRSGNLRPAAWIVLAVNEWVGLPMPFGKEANRP